jgi:hypothetical protein
MNEELEPLGLSTPLQDEQPTTFSGLVAEHPLLAITAAAAVGAGLMALLTAASRSNTGANLTSRTQEQASALYADLREQLSALAERVQAALPQRGEATAEAVTEAASATASTLDAAVDAAKRALLGGAAAGSKATHAAMAHPVLTSVVLGAVGAAVASLAAAQRQKEEATTAVPNGHDTPHPISVGASTP